MALSTFAARRQLERMTDAERAEWQLSRLNALLSEILPHNAFYRRKLAGVRLPLRTPDALCDLPLTTKDELATDDPAGWAANRTFPLERYVRLHRTSGTRGRPLAVLDTAEDWQWWVNGWQFVLDAADVHARDRAVMAFSFGPFIGFWSAYDACAARGLLVAPTGGMTTLARLDLIRSLRATCVLCTPSYALRMAEVAREHGIDLKSIGVRKLIVAGEPGGSVPAVRARIESAWNGEVIDHSGATEVGPWGYADQRRQGLHVNESQFIAEFLPLEGTSTDSELRELVLTTLGRAGSPVIRYRTGDVVRPRRDAAGENRFVLLEGGVVGRVDDMLTVRGVNVFPSAVEQILREIPEIDEFRIVALRRREMDELHIDVEDRQGDPARVEQALQLRLGLRVSVACVPAGSLPRFEGKGARFVDRRSNEGDTPCE